MFVCLFVCLCVCFNSQLKNRQYFCFKNYTMFPLLSVKRAFSSSSKVFFFILGVYVIAVSNSWPQSLPFQFQFVNGCIRPLLLSSAATVRLYPLPLTHSRPYVHLCSLVLCSSCVESIMKAVFCFPWYSCLPRGSIYSRYSVNICYECSFGPDYPNLRPKRSPYFVMHL